MTTKAAPEKAVDETVIESIPSRGGIRDFITQLATSGRTGVITYKEKIIANPTGLQLLLRADSPRNRPELHRLIKPLSNHLHLYGEDLPIQTK